MLKRLIEITTMIVEQKITGTQKSPNIRIVVAL
jgi:hypothetical protein